MKHDSKDVVLNPLQNHALFVVSNEAITERCYEGLDIQIHTLFMLNPHMPYAFAEARNHALFFIEGSDVTLEFILKERKRFIRRNFWHMKRVEALRVNQYTYRNHYIQPASDQFYMELLMTMGKMRGEAYSYRGVKMVHPEIALLDLAVTELGEQGLTAVPVMTADFTRRPTYLIDVNLVNATRLATKEELFMLPTYNSMPA